jgi:hypothetical protein
MRTARELGLPVVSNFMGRGLLDQVPDVLLGTYLGAAGDRAIHRRAISSRWLPRTFAVRIAGLACQ